MTEADAVFSAADVSSANNPLRVGDRYVEPRRRRLTRRNLPTVILLGVAITWLIVSFWLSEIDLGRLIEGLPRLINWLGKAWPPNVKEFDWVIYRAFQTLAIATAATFIASILALPLGVMAARNLSGAAFAVPLRMMLNALRGIDTIIFALLFVVAVGLGPFAGVLGMILHSIGVIGKLYSEAIETLDPGPIDAARITGANGAKLTSFAVLPAALPSFTSTALYMWEGNVRTSTVLGLVGAGGIGMEIKNSIDLLNFPRLLTLTVVMLVLVAAIDWLSSTLRRKLV
ncbi:phosphonate ABC transporter, permease protein PhnE [Rhizobium sp. 007]|uniref:phosphonate ABC transporter, permease protein PhnE n=1 Tax=Rhizobium sp. 007 TaxID=2785056 RepID=UPI00188ED4F3|nr:phosphonate ABC transporter, permease protein PhnE [Rhizobium sp. 007]QPB24514.1 phosphonate ABC transporter, permease protein PhnE [Rhizobium sp. 007]